MIGGKHGMSNQQLLGEQDENTRGGRFRWPQVAKARERDVVELISLVVERTAKNGKFRRRSIEKNAWGEDGRCDWRDQTVHNPKKPRGVDGVRPSV